MPWLSSFVYDLRASSANKNAPLYPWRLHRLRLYHFFYVLLGIIGAFSFIYSKILIKVPWNIHTLEIIKKILSVISIKKISNIFFVLSSLQWIWLCSIQMHNVCLFFFSWKQPILIEKPIFNFKKCIMKYMKGYEMYLNTKSQTIVEINRVLWVSFVEILWRQ